MIDNTPDNKVLASGKRDETIADLTANNFDADDESMHSESEFPRDHELLIAILGEDYATQDLSSNSVSRWEDFTDINDGESLLTETDEGDIDKSIRAILEEDNEHIDYLENESINSDSSDIDEFLKKYLTDDDIEEPSLESLLGDDNSKPLDDNNENDIDELIQKILNDEPLNESRSDENTLTNTPQVETNFQTDMTEPRSSHHASLTSPAQIRQVSKLPDINNNNHSAEKRSVAESVVINNSERNRMIGITVFLLVVSAVLIWFLAKTPQNESVQITDTKAGSVSAIKKSRVPDTRINSDLDHTASLRGGSNSTSKVDRASTEKPKFQPEKSTPAPEKPISSSSTIFNLIEGGIKTPEDSSTQELLVLNAENITHETVVETSIPVITEIAQNGVSDEFTKNNSYNSEPETITYEYTLLEQGGLYEEPENTTHESGSKPEISSIIDDSHNATSIDKNNFVKSTSTPEEGSSEFSSEKTTGVIPETGKNNSGFWALNLSSVHNQKKLATREMERIRSVGIPAEIKPVFVDEKKWYRIRVTGFSSYAKAEDFMAEVRVKTDIQNYWISRETVDSK